MRELSSIEAVAVAGGGKRKPSWTRATRARSSPFKQSTAGSTVAAAAPAAEPPCFVDHGDGTYTLTFNL